MIFSDPTSQLGLASATESHWASGYNSSYAAASYAAASSFAYGGGAATGSADLAGQQAAISEQSAASSQIPTGMPNYYLFIYFLYLFLMQETVQLISFILYRISSYSFHP